MIKNFIRKIYHKKKFFALMLLLSFSLFTLFSISGFSRHAHYMTSINDLGHFDQAVWGFLEGIPFLNTDIFNTQISRLGVHFDPILAFFVPFYLMIPSVNWLIIAQSLTLSMASWPIFFLAKKIFISDKTAFIWAVIFSLNSFILNTAVWEFHPVTLAVPFIAGAYLALEMQKIKWLIFCCIIILLCKEHFGLLVIGFGLLWGIKHRNWKPSLLLIFIGITHIWVVFNIVMPYFSPTGRHLMLSEGQGQLSRYAWLGSSAFEIISEIIQNPGHVLWTIIGPLDGAVYLLLLLLPSLGLSLIGIELLIPGMADLGANLLSANPLPRSPFSYHSATLIPVCTVAAMYGVRRILAIMKRWTLTELSIVLLINTLVLGWIFFPFFTLPGSFDIWKQKEFFEFNDPKLSRIKNLIAQDFAISVQANIGPHFTQRKEIYTYPNNIGQADAVVLMLESPTRQIQGSPGMVGSLAHHLQMKPPKFLDSVAALLENREYRMLLWDDPWLVFIKDDAVSQDKKIVLEKINKLALTWKQNEDGKTK